MERPHRRLGSGYLEPLIGWRGCFYALRAGGIALAVGMLFVKETPRQHLVAKAAGESAGKRPGFGEIARELRSCVLSPPAAT